MNARTPGEWHSHANSNLSSAYSTQIKAAKQMDTSKKAHQDCLSENIAMYQDLHQSLEQKVKTSHRLVEKLTARAKSVENSISSMQLSLQQLQAALRAKDAPLTLCAWRMEQREKRPLREHVRDEVELALEDERNVLMDTQRKLGDAIRVTQNMISVLEGKLDELRHDIAQKTQALSVDELCIRTTHRSWHSQVSAGGASSPSSRSSGAGTGRLPSARRTGATALAEESNRNEVNRQQEARRLDHAAKGREEAASELREDSHKLISRCEKAAQEAARKTEGALQDRIQEIQTMRRRLENEARETKRKEDHTRDTISETQSQIHSLEEPMQLCSTHASWRKQRANREQILDPVETRLEEQKGQLMRTREELHGHRQREKGILTQLQEHMERLKEDLRDKTQALNIDLNCLTHSSDLASPTLTDPSARARYSSLMKRANEGATPRHGSMTHRAISAR
mmetsp:Transcript_52063/g.91458  ORF Transcript_52063/g.91458 Transcript_52063/m.91458 type:complete len:455 (+) Transcript_52063:115-1479(+)